MLWLIGAGEMALEYAKVLNALNIKYIVIGRSKKSANSFNKFIKKKVFVGGLSKFLKTKPNIPSKVINSVNVEKLKSTSIELLNYGVKNILLEKPGGCNFGEVRKLKKLSKERKANIKIAFNRRFYASVLKLKQLIKLDGGVLSFTFDFTERTDLLEKENIKIKVLENWFLANSTHVLDLAFYLGGQPMNITPYISSRHKWNKSPSIYSGSGKTTKGSLFSYHANWQSGGRWSLEMLTSEGKYILRPLEKLFIQKRGTFEIKEIKLNKKLEKKFKPGFYLQTKSFIKGENNNLLSLDKYIKHLNFYNKISGNKK
ncbi:gfo/Idh/MocA family oxidoreductase [Candidatus Pelagibacter bacterium nBUS_28]|uniref:gfo/Idh/MocA family oxidoreductase n=1 Tax=Candidatus Pelagibacter bacterium nBUS_28 TaxID=3374189 RepID=UPI003EB95B50